MTDINAVYDALRRADAAGDTESAQKLADYIRQQTSPPEPVAPPTPAPEQQSSLRQVADVPLKVGAGVLSGFRMLTDSLGANNPVSQQLTGMEDSVAALFSAQSKNDSNEVSRIMKEAQDKGYGDQITAALQAFATAPVDISVNALGTMAPIIFGQLLKKGLQVIGVASKAAPAVSNLFTRLVPSKTSTAIGSVMGAGVIKSGIYDAVKEELTKIGMPPDQVEARAQLAQDYNGENLGLILSGTALGGLTAVTGVDPLLVKGMTKKIAGEIGKEVAKKGVVRRAVETGAAEAIPEMLQGGQEQYAKNVALQKEGFDVPTMRGVVGSGALEGLAGGVLGAGVGAISTQGGPEKETEDPKVEDLIYEEKADTEQVQNAKNKKYNSIVDLLMTDHVDERGNIIPKVTEIEAMQQAGVIIQEEEAKRRRRRGKGKNKKIVEDVTLAPEPEVLETPTPEVPVTPAPEAQVISTPEVPVTPAPEVPVTPAPEVPVTPAAFKTSMPLTPEQVQEYELIQVKNARDNEYNSIVKTLITDHIDERGNSVGKVSLQEALQQANAIMQIEEAPTQETTPELVTPAPAPKVLETPAPEVLETPAQKVLKTPASETLVTPERIKSLGIKETTPIAKRIINKDLNNSEDRAFVVTQLLTHAANNKVTPEVRANIKNFLAGVQNGSLYNKTSNKTSTEINPGALDGSVSTSEKPKGEVSKPPVKEVVLSGVVDDQENTRVSNVGKKATLLALKKVKPVAKPETKKELEAELEAKLEAESEAIQEQAETDVNAGPIGQAIAKIEDGDLETKAQVRSFVKKLERNGVLDDVGDAIEGLSDREQSAEDVLSILSELLEDARDNAVQDLVDERQLEADANREQIAKKRNERDIKDADENDSDGWENEQDIIDIDIDGNDSGRPEDLYRTAPKGTRGISVDEVKRAVGNIAAKWTHAPKISIVQSVSDLPSHVQKRTNIKKDEVVRGLFDPQTKKVYLIADHITDSRDAIITLAHEALGHYGLRAVLGNKYPSMMDHFYNTNEAVRKAADIKIKKEGLDKNIAVEEVLADMQGERAVKSIWQSIKNITRQLLQKLGVTKPTDKEINDLLARARDFVVKGVGKGRGRQQEGGDVLASAKVDRLKATGSSKAWILFSEASRGINFANIKILDQARDAAEAHYKEQLKNIPEFDGKAFLEGLTIDDINAYPPEIQDAIQMYKDGDKAGGIQEIFNTVSGQRRENIREWKQYLENINPEMKKDPFWRDYVITSLLKSIRTDKPDTGLPLNANALGQVYEKFKQGNHVNFATAYQSKLVDTTNDLVELGDETTGWRKIPQTSKNDPKFGERVKAVQSLSCIGWCTRNSMAAPYIQKGDFWVYVDDKKPQVAIRFEGDKVHEIQGPQNTRAIPTKYIKEITNLVDSGKIKNMTEQTKGDIAKAVKKSQFEAMIKEKLASGELVEKDRAFAKKNGLNIAKEAKVYADVDGWITVDGYVDISKGVSAPKLTTVSGAIDIYSGASAPALATVSGGVWIAEGARAPALTTVGGDAYIHEGVSAPALTTVGGDAVIRTGASVPKLTTVGGDAYIHEGARAPALTTVSGNAYIREGASAPALTTVGGDAKIYSRVPALTTVGGYARIYGGASAPALTTVGGDAYIHEGVSAPALTTVGGRVDINEGASAPKLTTVGGSAFVAERASAPNITRQNIGKEAALKGTPLDPNKQAEAKEDELLEWFGKSKIINADGTPEVWYHGTARNISEFKPKQVGAIFLTKEPKFAESFADASAEWIGHNAETLLSPEDYAELSTILAKIRKDNPKNYSDKIDEASKEFVLGKLDSGENIMPLFVRAENPFDYENPQHIDKAFPSLDKNSARFISGGSWNVLEQADKQKAIKAAGFDSFYVNEGGHKNLAVYSANQVKSAIGNTGAYSRSDDRIVYSKKKVNKLDEKLKASHSATDLNVGIGRLIKTTRNAKDAIRLLKAVRGGLNVGSIRKILPTLTTQDIVRWVGDKIANINKVNDAVQEMSGMRHKMIRELSDQVPAWAKFNRKSKRGGELLADVMNAATLEQVDPDKYKTLADALQNDAEIKRLKLAYADPNLEGRKKSAAMGLITKRKNQIIKLYTMWDSLGKIAGGKGHDIYRMARDKYKETLNLHEQILTEKILLSSVPGSIDDSSTPKGKLMAEITKMFQEAKKLNIYFPLMRYGPFWFSIGEGPSGEQFMFESATARNNAVDKYIAELNSKGDSRTKEGMVEDLTLDFGDNLLQMRDGVVEASQMLKGIFELLDINEPSDIEAIKDGIYQMYLRTLPEKDIRRRFTHRQGKTGFSADVLRNFITSQNTASNQLSRLKYSDKIRNALGSAYDELKGNPDKLRLNAFVDEIALRVGAELMPQVTEEFNLDALASLGNQAVFLYMLTAPKSALVQMTQLPIVGLPVLQANYGFVKASKAFARYSFLFDKLGTSKKDADGNVTTNWNQPSINNSSYINKHPNSRALKIAWEAANNRDIFMSTYASDMTSRTRISTSEYEAWTGKGFRSVVNFMSGAFHHLERISREIMYMASFELEFAKLKKEGMSDADATERGIKKAISLIDEALFNYTQFNKPRFMKAGLMRIPTQFMTYPMQITSFLTRNFFTMLSKLPAKDRKDAAVKFFGTLGMTGLFSGVVGLPLYSFIMSAAEGVRELMRPDMDSDDDDPYYDDNDENNPLGKRKLDLWFRETFIPEFFGKDSSLAKALGLTDEQALMLQRSVKMGPIPALTDSNIGASTSLNNLWFTEEIPAKNSKEAFQQMLVSATGPFGGMMEQMAGALDDFFGGHINRGVEKILPAFLRGYATAFRLYNEGLQTRLGYVTRKPEWYTAGKLLPQALGFQSTETAEVQKRNFLASSMKNKIKNAKQEALNNFDLTIREYIDNDSKVNEEKIDEAIKGIRAYNYKNIPYVITGDQLNKIVESHAKKRAMAIEGLGVDELDYAVLMPLLEKAMVPQK